MSNLPLVEADVQFDLSILCPDIEDLPELATRWAKEDARDGAPRNAEPFQGTPAAVVAYNEAYDELALLDEALETYRQSVTPIVYLTDEQMDAIEAERPGEEICLRPMDW